MFNALFGKKTELPWWIEIRTLTPNCTYHFGPFESQQEAQLHQEGYIADLLQEQAKGIAVDIRRHQPQELTVSTDV